MTYEEFATTNQILGGAIDQIRRAGPCLRKNRPSHPRIQFHRVHASGVPRQTNLALRSRCCVRTFSLIAHLRLRAGAKFLREVFVYHPGQQAKHPLIGFLRHLRLWHRRSK